MTRASSAPDDSLMTQVPRFDLRRQTPVRPTLSNPLGGCPASPFPRSPWQAFVLCDAWRRCHQGKNHAEREADPAVSIVGIADVAIEADVDLPGPALCLHEVGQHGAVALDDGFDVLAQYRHEVGDFLPQRVLGDGGALALRDDNAAGDNDGFDGATGFREHDLARDAVEWNEGGIG